MKGSITIKRSVLVIGVLLAAVLFLAGLFTHELIFPQRGIKELQAQIGELRGQVKALGEQVASLIKTIRPQDTSDRKPQPQDSNRSGVSIDDDPVLGQAGAPVVIVEFSDFQCPYCARFVAQTMPQLKREYIDTGKAIFVFRDFPLASHRNAELAAEAAQCAFEQDSYWEMHDRIFAGQREWSNSSTAKQVFIGYTAELGLNRASFRECLDSGRYKEEVQRDLKDGVRYGVRGTPTFFINGRKLVGAQSFGAFQQIIEEELEKKGE